MSINSNKSNAANNSNGKRTAQPSEMGKYSTPELQAAFNTGREIGEPKECYTTSNMLPKICKRKQRS